MSYYSRVKTAVVFEYSRRFKVPENVVTSVMGNVPSLINSVLRHSRLYGDEGADLVSLATIVEAAKTLDEHGCFPDD